MLKIVDGLREKPHVTSNDHFGRNEGIVGISDYVLNVGRMFETELISSNALRIYDGEGMIQGCHWRILPGTYETVTLSNGTQGKKRIDYVVARYEKNSVGYEDIGISVKEGEATSENPKPPAYITGDIRAGDTIREMVLAEIEYEGINVVEVTPKFKVLMTMAELQEKTDELNRNFKESVYADGYMVVDIGALPNNSTKSVPANIPSASEYWISDAWCKSRTTGQVSPMPYIDASTWSNAIGITISASKNIVVTTKADWSAYSGKAIIAYKL